MQITKLELINFKRFTHLLIKDIPADTRLVLLIGANGSGKSSVFDALELLNKVIRGEGPSPQWVDYYCKQAKRDFKIVIDKGLGDIEIIGKEPNRESLRGINFYGRSSFRQVPRLIRTKLGDTRFDFKQDSDRPKYFIDRDERFENDLESITGIILRDFFRAPDAGTKIRERFLDPINRALANIFGAKNGNKLELIEIIPPLEGNIAQVTFRKGNSEFHYNQLSAGEKEVINILINLSSRKESLEDAICFFDEIDLHLNTKLQFELLREITEHWIPASSQFWTASHSLGFIEYARSSPYAVILDFDDLDYDLPQTLTPVPDDQADVYEIAVGKEFLPALFAGKRLCFVENNDRDYYGSLGLPNVLFASAANRNDVYHKVRNEPTVWGIVDRDFLTDEDIALIRNQYPRLFILPFYSIENLMYHPDNLAEYYHIKGQAFDRADYLRRLTEHKNQIRSSLVLSLMTNRTSYHYFGEQEFAGQPRQNRFRIKQENNDQSLVLSTWLDSDAFDLWYKIFPMKSYATDLPQRQHIPKPELIKTAWFKNQIEQMFVSVYA